MPMLSVEDEDGDDNDDQEQEEDDEPVNTPSTNTMLHDKDIAEYLCFPTTFCGQ